MNLDTLPGKIVTRCFSYLSTDSLTDIILLENIPDKIIQAAAYNLNNLWYSKRFRSVEKVKVANIEAYYETDFERFLRIHKILEEKSFKCPLWFHCTWDNILEMHQNLASIDLVYNGQKLGIHADLEDPAFQTYPIFSTHDINLKITCLSLNSFYKRCINLDNFPKLETFYGYYCEISVDHDHPSLKNLYLHQVTFSSLPTNLIKLVAKECWINMDETHPKLKALTLLTLERTDERTDCFSLLRLLWNKNLEHFSFIGQGVIEENESREEDEIFSMIGPKVTSLGKSGSIPASIPTLRSLYSISGRGLENLNAYTHMTSLTLWEPSDINNCNLPPNLLRLTLNLPDDTIERLKFPLSLLKLSITSAKFNDLTKIEFPPKLVDLELELCDIALTTGWLKPAQLKRLSLARNNLSSFKAVLPCCEFLSLSDNKIEKVEIEAPVLKNIDLSENKLTYIPELPASVQVLVFRYNNLALSEMSEMPPNLKFLDLSDAGTGTLKNYTFPSSIQELHLTGLDLSGMSGVKFAKGSRMIELDLSCSLLGKIDDKMIELPLGLKSLDMCGNHFNHIKKLTIPQTVTFLNLGSNLMRSLEVKSHIETLYLNVNPRLSSLAIPKDLELKFLDLTQTGIKKFSFDIFGADKLTQLRLGSEVKVIDLSKMPVNFQVLEYPGYCQIKGLRRHLNTNIYRRHEVSEL